MKPIEYFASVWSRCDKLSAIYNVLEGAPANDDAKEVLRLEWVARVSALDLFIHELIAQRMVEIFEGRKGPCPGYLKFRIPNETLHRIKRASDPVEASLAFDFTLREFLSYHSFQDPERITEGIKMCSAIPLWNSVATHLGAQPAQQAQYAKDLRDNLSIIVSRRNKIAHEGDLQPTPPRDEWPINRDDLLIVKETIEKIVFAINAVV